jgi:hypothetical protein
MVTKATKYHCDLCGWGFENESEAENCEDCHLIYRRVVETVYQSPLSNYPNLVQLSFEDGTRRDYELVQKRR